MMTPLHIALLASVAMGALAGGIIMGLCIIGKSASDAMSRALDERVDEKMHKVLTCTRPAPHVCKLNGPCNGLSKSAPLLPVPGRKRTGWTRYGCGCREDRYVNPDKSITTERTYYNGTKENL